MYVDIKGQFIFFLNLSPTVSPFFCQLSLFQKNSNEMFSMFFEGKKHRKFYWNIFESDDLDFFLRKCWTQKIYQIQNSGYGQESLGFKILENVCFFHTFYFWSTYQVVTREGQVIVFFGLTVSPNLFRRSKCLMFKMFRRSKCFDAQNVSSLSTFKNFFK